MFGLSDTVLLAILTLVGAFLAGFWAFAGAVVTAYLTYRVKQIETEARNREARQAARFAKIQARVDSNGEDGP